MSFLSVIFLAAIPLIGFPVVLHFYKRRQRDVIAWGAMQFLTDVAIKGQRFERLEELILLLLRALAVAALVFAMAQPVVQSEWIGGTTNQDVILVLDDSMSMSRSVDGTSALDRLQERVNDLLADLNSEHSIQVMLATGGGRWLTSGPVAANGRTKRELAAVIEDLRTSGGAADMFACLQWVVDSEPTNQARSRRVFVFTDCQEYGWITDVEGPWQQLQLSCQNSDVEGRKAVPTSIQIIDCGSDEAPTDVAIVRLNASRTMTGSGDRVNFSTEIKNVGREKSRSAKLQWLVDGDQLGESSTPELAPGESIQRTWSHVFEKEGVFAVRCTVETGDQLPMDDEQTVVIEVVDKIPFLIIDKPTVTDSDFAAARLLTATLGYEKNNPLGKWQSMFTPHVIDHDRLQDESLAKYRAVIIADTPGLPADVVDRLRSFVDRGGGLWAALGNQTDRERFNSTWFDEGDGLSPLKLGAPVGKGRVADAEFAIHPPSADHVVTKQIADTNRLDIDEVKISRHHQFVLEEDDTDVSVLLESGVGAPLMVENYVGRGRVIVQAVPLGLQWSNLPLTKAYVVMVHDILSYLTEPAATQFNLELGGEIVYPTPRELTDTKGQLETPLGDTVSLTLHDEEDASLCRFSGTYMPGVYKLSFVHGDRSLMTLPFHVTRDVEESNLDRLSVEQKNWLADNGGIEFVEKADMSVESTTPLSSPRPVWWMLLAFLLIVIVAELALASLSAQRRYAPAGAYGTK